MSSLSLVRSALDAHAGEFMPSSSRGDAGGDGGGAAEARLKQRIARALAGKLRSLSATRRALKSQWLVRRKQRIAARRERASLDLVLARASLRRPRVALLLAGAGALDARLPASVDLYRQPSGYGGGDGGRRGPPGPATDEQRPH